MKKILSLMFIGLMTLSAAQAQTADEIAKKYVNAIGGAAKWKAIDSRKMTITMMTQGIQLPGTIVGDKANRQRVEFNFNGMKIVQAYDGETAWMINPPQGMTTPTKLTGAQAEGMANNQFLDDFIDYAKRGSALELKGDEELEGTTYTRVDLTNKDGKSKSYYFDKNTHLIMAVKEENAFGQSTITLMEDYQEIDGVKVAMKLSVKVGAIVVQQIKVDKVEHNVALTDDMFAFPGN